MTPTKIPDASLALTLVLAKCMWPLNFFEEGKFDMSWWAFAFPLNVFAAASILVYDLTKYDAMRVRTRVLSKENRLHD